MRLLVQEYLKTKDKVCKNYITERTGELGAQQELTKSFKPVIEMQKAVAKDLAKEITEPVTSALQPITEGVQKANELAKYPSIQAAKTDQDIDTSMVILGTVAGNYPSLQVRKMLTKHLDCTTNMANFSSVTVPSR